MAGAGRVVIGGAGGFMGTELVSHLRRRDREVVTVGRSLAGSDIAWGDVAGLARAVDGADLVVGLSGMSVNCRYTAKNRAELMRSRTETTRALAAAITGAASPPPLWLNASTATIYRHAMDRPQTEANGEIGTGFSVDVARAWERELFRASLPATRRVALRTGIVLGPGGALAPLARLARLGLGGPQIDGPWPISAGRRAAGTAHEQGSRGGMQRFSWIHLDDVVRVVDFIEHNTEIAGAVNVTSPAPSDSRTLMRLIREAVGAPFGLPCPRFLLELGAILIRTEAELVLKSRWVLPEKLLAAGFEFSHPELGPALKELLS